MAEKSYREKLGFEAYVAKKIDCSKTEVIDPKTGKTKLVPSVNLVEKHHATELDINKIVKRYTPKELLAQATLVDALYGDFSTFQGLQEASMQMEAAMEEFNALPAEIRREFDNNPGQLVKAIDQAQSGDAQVREKLVKMGVFQAPPPPPAQVPPPAAKPAGTPNT